MRNNLKTTAILVSGGVGKRLGEALPKQYLSLNGKPIARYSFDVLLESDAIDEIVVVCSPEFIDVFKTEGNKKPIHFALPGDRRQDSVYNGLQAASKGQDFILTHDAARPFIDGMLINRVLDAACICPKNLKNGDLDLAKNPEFDHLEKHTYHHMGPFLDVKSRELSLKPKTNLSDSLGVYGAATAAMPLPFTVKEVDHNLMVTATPDRSKFWEIQTPQIVRKSVLETGFGIALEKGLNVTDDVSLAELAGCPVQLVEGSHWNVKITYPKDMVFAHAVVNSLSCSIPNNFQKWEFGQGQIPGGRNTHS